MRARDLAQRDFPQVYPGLRRRRGRPAAEPRAPARPGGARPRGTPVHRPARARRSCGSSCPRYVQDDPPLARVFDEQASDELCAKLAKRTVADLLPDKHDVDEIPIVAPDATVIEIAAVMARMHSPVVAVVDDDDVLGAITVRRLLDHLLPADA